MCIKQGAKAHHGLRETSLKVSKVGMADAETDFQRYEATSPQIQGGGLWDAQVVLFSLPLSQLPTMTPSILRMPFNYQVARSTALSPNRAPALAVGRWDLGLSWKQLEGRLCARK